VQLNVAILIAPNYRNTMNSAVVYLNRKNWKVSIEHLCRRVHNGYRIYSLVFVYKQRLLICMYEKNKTKSILRFSYTKISFSGTNSIRYSRRYIRSETTSKWNSWCWRSSTSVNILSSFKILSRSFSIRFQYWWHGSYVNGSASADTCRK